MKVLVVYDSVFSNTEQIARTIGNIPGSQEDVGILRASHVKPEQLTGVEFLIVGYSTRRFKPTAAINTFLKRIPKKYARLIFQGVYNHKTMNFSTYDKLCPCLQFLARKE